MNVEELINELMATCQSLDDDVMLYLPTGLAETVLKVSTIPGIRNTLYLNRYPDPDRQKNDE